MYDIQLDNIGFCYDTVCAIADVSINIKKGEFTAIIGPNGGGKSTLLKIILGLLKPDTGKIILRKDAVPGYLPQVSVFDRSFPITVEETVLTGTLPAKIRVFHKYSEENKKSAIAAMEYVSIVPLSTRRVDQLSSGQLKRVLIARSLAGGCDILVLDEPEESLDKNSAGELNSLIESFRGKLTIILVTHNIDFALKTADSFIYVSHNVEYIENNHEGREYLVKVYNGSHAAVAGRRSKNV